MPAEWEELWDDGPEGATDFCCAAMARASGMHAWLAQSAAGSLLGSGAPLQLSQLFTPRTFLDALRQQAARYDFVLRHLGVNNNIGMCPSWPPSGGMALAWVPTPLFNRQWMPLCGNAGGCNVPWMSCGW